MTPLDAARSYVQRGFAVTPTRGKAPVLDGWQERVLAETELSEHFTAGINVGVLNGAPSGGLVDIDLDAAEAVALADTFLPETGCVFGRASKSRSHRVYLVEPLVPTKKYEDVKDPTTAVEKTMLVELRSTGTQTVWPGSIHDPSGEAVTFDSEGEPAKVTGAVLQASVTQLAICTLLARHWPTVSGSRHEIALAASGFLVRAGIETAIVEKIIANAARVAGDPEIQDRISAVRTTAQKITAGAQTTGGPTLADLLGEKVVAKLGGWLGVAADKEPPAWAPPVPFRTYNLPAFPVDALPPWLRNYVAAEAEATQTPTDLAGMLVVATVAATSAGKVEVIVDADWKEPVNLFVVVVQEPGTRKSAVMAHLITPLERFEATMLAEAKPLIAEAETRRRIAEQMLQRAQQEAAKASGVERVAAVERASQLARELDAVVVPGVPRLLADDCSAERLATLMRDQGGPIAVMSPEGDLFDLMAGRYSKTGVPNIGVYLKAHAGDPLRVDRVTRESEFIARPALTLGLAVQPDVLRGMAARPEFRGRGLLARFLYALPRNLLGTRRVDPSAVPAAVRAAYENNMQKLLSLSANTDADGRPAPHLLKLSDAARLRLREFQRDVERQLGEFGDLHGIADWASKLPGGVVRIAAILHMAGNVTELNPWSRRIELDTIERAIAVAAYLIPHATAAFSEMGADPAMADAQHVLRWVKRAALTAFTVRDAFQGTKGRFRRVAALEPALQVLVEHGYLRERAADDRRGPGRKPSPTFEVNPAVPRPDSENSETAARREREERNRDDGVFSTREVEEESSRSNSSSSYSPPEGNLPVSQNSQNSRKPEDREDEETIEWTA